MNICTQSIYYSPLYRLIDFQGNQLVGREACSLVNLFHKKLKFNKDQMYQIKILKHLHLDLVI